jgi:hypothetical protein
VSGKEVRREVQASSERATASRCGKRRFMGLSPLICKGWSMKVYAFKRPVFAIKNVSLRQITGRITQGRVFIFKFVE